MHSTTVAVDLAKNVFELAVADAAGKIVDRQRLASDAGAPTKPNMYWWSATGELKVLYVVIGCAIGWRVS
jgi:hypothetical protein